MKKDNPTPKNPQQRNPIRKQAKGKHRDFLKNLFRNRIKIIKLQQIKKIRMLREKQENVNIWT